MIKISNNTHIEIVLLKKFDIYIYIYTHNKFVILGNNIWIWKHINIKIIIYLVWIYWKI